MAKTVHYRLPAKARDGFQGRASCGTKSDSLSADVTVVTCRRCRGSEIFRARLEWTNKRTAAKAKKT